MATTIHDMETGTQIDQRRIEEAVREILIAVGEDPDREGLRRTPQRVAQEINKMKKEMAKKLKSV